MLSTKTEVHNALPTEEDRAMATGNMYRKFGKIQMYGFQDGLGFTSHSTQIGHIRDFLDRQTSRQTYRHAILCTPTEGKATTWQKQLTQQ